MAPKRQSKKRALSPAPEAAPDAAAVLRAPAEALAAFLDSTSDTSFCDTVVLVGATAAASPLFKAALKQLPDSVVYSPKSVADIGDALGRHCPKHVVLVADLNAVKVPDLAGRTPGGK
jgi:hypothetical protein